MIYSKGFLSGFAREHAWKTVTIGILDTRVSFDFFSLPSLPSLEYSWRDCGFAARSPPPSPSPPSPKYRDRSVRSSRGISRKRKTAFRLSLQLIRLLCIKLNCNSQLFSCEHIILLFFIGSSASRLLSLGSFSRLIICPSDFVHCDSNELSD